MIIRYGWEPIVKTTLMGEIEGVPANSLSTSLNPFLHKYGYFKKNFVGSETCRPILLNIDELVQEAEKVIFFTYIMDIEMKRDNVIVIKYPYPACAPEMEIRFTFSSENEFRGKICQDVDRLVDAVRWTGLVDIARQLSDKVMAKQYHYLDTYGIDLNTYYLMEQQNMIKKNKEDVRKAFRPLIQLIKQYDTQINKIALKFISF